MKNLHQAQGRRVRRAGVVAVALAVAVSLAACTSGTNTTSASKSPAPIKTQVVFGSPFNLTNWDPALAGDETSSFFHEFVYSSLLKLNPDLTISPNLATKWSYNSSKTVLTLTIKANEKFSSGATLDANSVKDNLLRGEKANGTSAQALADIKSISVSSSTELALHLTSPNPALLFNLAKDPGRIINPKDFASAKVAPAGSGPYVLDAAASTAGTQYVFTRNTYYDLPTKYGFDKATVKVYPNFNALIGAGTSGQVDQVGMPSFLVPTAVKAGLKTLPVAGNVAALWISDRNGKITPALKDVRVRQAINYAIDGDAILKGTGGGAGVRVTQMFGAGTPAYVSSLNTIYPHNVAKAKQLLAAAGYPNGFTLKMPSGDPTEAQLYPVIQQELAAVGITVVYVPVAANAVTTAGLSGDYSAFLSYTNPTDNWVDATNLLSPNGDLNPFHTNDPKVTALLSKIRVADPATQATLYKELNTYIVKQAWFSPSFFGYVYLAYNAKVMKVNLPTNALSSPVYAFQPAN